MKEPIELITTKQQRDNPAKLIFEEDSGALDYICCLPEMKVGLYPYSDAPYGIDRATRTCVPCIVRLIGGGGE